MVSLLKRVLAAQDSVGEYVSQVYKYDLPGSVYKVKLW